MTDFLLSDENNYDPNKHLQNTIDNILEKQREPVATMLDTKPISASALLGLELKDDKDQLDTGSGIVTLPSKDWLNDIVSLEPSEYESYLNPLHEKELDVKEELSKIHEELADARKEHNVLHKENKELRMENEKLKTQLKKQGTKNRTLRKDNEDIKHRMGKELRNYQSQTDDLQLRMNEAEWRLDIKETGR